jgi:hypothetical protein
MKCNDNLARKLYWLILLIFFSFLGLKILTAWSWDYDSYGAIASHIELDNPIFYKKYNEMLIGIGVSEYFSKFIVDYILPVVIVPVRWTYALGISPIYSIVRVLEVDWPLMRDIILFIHAAISIVAIHLISKSFSEIKLRLGVALIIISFILLSDVYSYWILTFTSYSFHLLCFGLLLTSESDSNHHDVVFSFKAFSRSIVQILNYQYFLILAIIGVVYFIQNKLDFFKKGLYKSWIIPFFIGVFSVGFIVFRGMVFDLHQDPMWRVGTYDSYFINISEQSIANSIGFFVSRFYDILTYFFVNIDNFSYYSVDRFSTLSYLYIVVTLFFLFLFIFLWMRVLAVKKYTIVILSSIVAPLLLYLFLIQPMTPTRHSLVLYMPLVFFVTVPMYLKLSEKYQQYTIYILFLLFTVALYLSVSKITYNKNELNSNLISNLMHKHKVERLVLHPCDLNPIFYNNIRKKYSPLYRCGNTILGKISEGSDTIAVYSEKEINSKRALEIVKDYSSVKWISDNGKSYLCVDNSRKSKCKFYILTKSEVN